MLSQDLASHSFLARTETETLRPERVEGGPPCWDPSASSLLLLAEPSLSRHETRDLPDKSGQGWVGGWAGLSDGGRAEVPRPSSVRAHLPKHGHARLVNVLLLQHHPARPKQKGESERAHGLWPFLAHGHGQ